MIEIRNLEKNYGMRTALGGVTLDVEAGDMFGLIGPNGAGKTTLIRILATLVRPSGGSAAVDGNNVAVKPLEVRRTIGYMPDYFGVYEELKVQEYLDFFAAAYGLRGAKRRATVEGVLELVDLAKRRKAPIAALSRGLQQRVGLARVLIHDPKVLLLDEPASGLDPRARIELRALLKELRKMGKTILISSHILADLGELCNKIGLLEKGKLIYAGPTREAMLKVRVENAWIVEVAGDGARAAELLRGQPFVESVAEHDGQLRVTLRAGADPEEVPRAVVQEGLRLRLFMPAEATLEDAFLRLTEGEIS